MLVGRIESASPIKTNKKQSKPSHGTLAVRSSTFPTMYICGQRKVSVNGRLIRDRLLPLGRGAIAVIIGIITLFVISSAISIIIVLK